LILWFRLETKKQKARQRWSPAGLVFPDLFGRLHQAMQVRRHGMSMMVVTNVMAATLHLINKLRAAPMLCQP